MRKDVEKLSRLIVPVIALLIFLSPISTFAADLKTFSSEEYGFTIKYPATWVKIDKPQGNYYVVFQDPDLTDNFRAKIHIAAHKPVKDPLNVFLQELRNGITDLQKGVGSAKEKQEVRILDEGEFKCEVPGAYYFFIQAYENNPKIWMDIVIVFYKLDDTLVRVSCLAPSKSMEKFHQLFNDVLLSMHFNQAGAASNQNNQQKQPAAVTNQIQPTAPAQVPPGPGVGAPVQQPQPGQPSTMGQGAPNMQPAVPPASPAQRPGPRGPSRESDRPATGIVN